MNKYSQKALFVFLIYVTCAILHVSVAELHLKNTLIISCILFLFNSYVVLESKGSTLCFLQPSVFGVNYIYLSMALGALTFASDIVILPRMITESSRWTDGVTPIAFLGGFVAVVILISDYRPTTASWLLPGRSPITMLVLLLATIGTAVAGKATNFIFLPETTGGMFMLYVLHVIGLRNGKTRVLFYLAAIVPLTVLFAEDKRDAIFLVVPIAFSGTYCAGLSFVHTGSGGANVSCRPRYRRSGSDGFGVAQPFIRWYQLDLGDVVGGRQLCCREVVLGLRFAQFRTRVHLLSYVQRYQLRVGGSADASAREHVCQAAVHFDP